MKTEEVGQEVLEHFGVKGMHWGVRKERVRSGASKVSTFVKDVNFEKQSTTRDTKIAIVENATKKLSADLPGLKAKHGSAGEFRTRIKNPVSKEARAYRKDVRDTYVKHLEASANEMRNASGSRQRTLDQPGFAIDLSTFAITEHSIPNTSRYFWRVSTKPIQHANQYFLTVEPIFDADGFIIDVEPVVDSMQQAEEFINNLFHFGVKGMHWGVRRERLRETRLTKRGEEEAKRRADPNRKPAPVRVVDSIGKSSLSKTKLKVVGGEDHPASEDAIKVASSRQKMRKSGIHTLSNSELQQMAQRMNLEAQVTSLNSRRKRSMGQGFVDAHLARALKDPIGTVMKTHKVATAHRTPKPRPTIVNTHLIP